MTAEVVYLQWVPGKRHFECSRIHGVLSTEDCAVRHSNATARNEASARFTACKHCPLGALHLQQTAEPEKAATTLPTVLPDTGAHCLRCGRSEVRMVIASGICVSCANRASEYRRGRNSKGTAPATYVPPRPRRIGVMVDGAPAWRLFEGQNSAEPLARARRLGLEMHSAAPGQASWNAERGAFEYVDELGRVLVELEVDGELHFIPVDQTRDGEVPVQVVARTTELSADLLAMWLRLSGEALGEDWRYQDVLCSNCRHSPLHARRRAGRYECRCPACSEKAAA